MKKLIIISIVVVLIICAAVSVSNVYAAEVTDEAVNESVPVSEMIKDFIAGHAGEAASILGVVVTLILTIMYKKGLLPVISKGFGNLVEMLNSFKHSTEKHVESLGENMKPVIDKMEQAITECERMRDEFDKLQKLYETQEADKKALEDKIARSDKLNELTCNLIYEIFMNTKLPQYVKDDLATYYKSIRAAIAGEVTADESKE